LGKARAARVSKPERRAPAGRDKKAGKKPGAKRGARKTRG